MATTQNLYTGDGSTTNYSFTFEYLKQADVKVTLDTVATTAFTFANATTLSFTSAPANNVAIRIFRDTAIDTLSSTFFPGSTIKAEDLNQNFTQNLYVTQESETAVDISDTTANTAKTTAEGAVTTANSAVTTANSAVTTANSAVTTANSAVNTANAASVAVSNAVLFTLVATVAAIPGSPSNNDFIEIGNSTGIESFSPLSGLPSGFVGASGLTVRLRYDSSASTWVFMSYFANDSEDRYLTKNIPLGSATAPSLVFAGDTNTGIYSPGADQVAITTGGTERLRIASTGAMGLSGANYGTAGQVLVSNGSSAAPTWKQETYTYPGGVEQTVQARLEQYVSVKDFGAVGDGVADDLAVVKLALESGKVVDGGGFSYAISGTLKPTSFKGLVNATLIQIGDNTSTNLTTLDLEGLSNFIIQNVTINMGANVTTLFSDDGNNGVRIMGTQSGSGTSTTTTYVENFTLSNVFVTGNGCGTGIHIRHAKRFTVLDCIVRDRVSGSSPAPTNDTQNGFEINNCANFELVGCTAYNLLTKLSGVDTNKWTRGFLFVEIRDCTINGCNSVFNDQGYDFSGGVSDTSPSSYEGNRRFTIAGCSAAVNGTFGFKFANVTHDGLITGCSVSNVGNTGFVVSSQLTSIVLSNDSYRTQNLTFTGCQVVNSLNNGWSGFTSAGFYVKGDAAGLYPRNIKFSDCSVNDNQTVVTTQNGFVTNVPAVGLFSTGYNTDVTITTKDCNVFRAVIPYYGIHFPGVSLTGSGSASINDSTWTSIDFNATGIYDPSGLHTPSSNTDLVVIKEAGLYFFSATAMYDITASGLRKIRIARNGVSTGLEYTYAAHPTNYTTISATGCLYFSSGDTARVDVWQNSGGSLNVERGSSFLSMARVA